MYDNFMNKLHEELEAIDKKVAQGHDLEKTEYECAKTWAKTVVALQTMEAMEEEYGEGEETGASYARGDMRGGNGSRRYSRNGGGSYRRSMSPYPMYPYYGDGGSYRRGMNRNGGRGSYHGEEESEAMEKLQEAYENATSEQERKTIRKLIDQMGE